MKLSPLSSSLPLASSFAKRFANTVRKIILNTSCTCYFFNYSHNLNLIFILSRGLLVFGVGLYTEARYINGTYEFNGDVVSFLDVFSEKDIPEGAPLAVVEEFIFLLYNVLFLAGEVCDLRLLLIHQTHNRFGAFRRLHGFSRTAWAQPYERRRHEMLGT